MTRNGALSASMFNTVTRARQAYVAACKAVDEADESCDCPRGRCADCRDLATAQLEAYADLREREGAWSEFCAAFM
tara:strand:- start:513 stop:740 length:228 start_codon:yes stop_codon:yes gene_type:complete